MATSSRRRATGNSTPGARCGAVAPRSRCARRAGTSWSAHAETETRIVSALLRVARVSPRPVGAFDRGRSASLQIRHPDFLISSTNSQGAVVISTAPLLETSFPNLTLHGRGKVRDIYAV